MNSVQRSLALARVCARRYCSTSGGVPSQYFQSLKKKQARFQSDDGIPIFLKGGAKDKIFFQTTIILLLVGGAMMIKLFVDLALPKKN